MIFEINHADAKNGVRTSVLLVNPTERKAEKDDTSRRANSEYFYLVRNFIIASIDMLIT